MSRVMALGPESGQAAECSGPANVLATRGRTMTAAQAEEVLWQRYGIAARATPLRSERDQNFLMSANAGRQVVLKLGNASQERGLIRFQTRALTHIAAVDPDLPVPRVVPTVADAMHFEWNDGDCADRLGFVVSFLVGAPLAEQPRSAALAARTGALAARLGRALRGFFDPAAGHELLWDFQHASRLTALVPHIPSDHHRRLAAAAIDRFQTKVEPRLPGLRGQVIHNDLNPHNLLVDPARPDVPTGIIDFGDMLFGALVGDLAVAAAYLVVPETDPFALIAAFVVAYHAVTPLEAEEIAVLPDLIATRHAMICAISAWRAARYPDNAAYILRNAEAAAVGLEALSGSGRDALRRRLAACAGSAAR